MSGSGRRRPISVSLICRRLARAYGPVEAPRKRPVLDQLIATILSQNTSDTNSRAAFRRLKERFPDWDAVRRAPVEAVAEAIRCAGLSAQKAPRIQAILEQVRSQFGRLSLERLRRMPAGEALSLLQQFPGVGPKTAACVLLFACRRPVLPVDTHVHRVSRRLGLIGPRTDAARAHEALSRIVPPHRVLDFHLQLIRHGRKVCRARRPRCPQCVLADRCPQAGRD